MTTSRDDQLRPSPSTGQRLKGGIVATCAWLAPPAVFVVTMIATILIAVLAVRGLKGAKFGVDAIVAFLVPYPFAAMLAADVLRDRPLIDRVAGAVLATFPLGLIALPALLALELWPL